MSLQDLQNLIKVIEVDYTEFQKGNNTAGTRARKSLLELKKLCDKMRKDILEKQKLEKEKKKKEKEKVNKKKEKKEKKVRKSKK